MRRLETFFSEHQCIWILIFVVCSLLSFGIIAYIPLINMSIVGDIPFDVPFVFFNATVNINHVYAAIALCTAFTLLCSSWAILCRGIVKCLKNIITTVFAVILIPASLLLSWVSYTPHFIPVDAASDSSSYRLISQVNETFTHIYTDVYVIHGQVGIAKPTNISYDKSDFHNKNLKVFVRWVNGQAIITVGNNTYYYQPALD